MEHSKLGYDGHFFADQSRPGPLKLPFRVVGVLASVVSLVVVLVVLVLRFVVFVVVVLVVLVASSLLVSSLGVVPCGRSACRSSCVVVLRVAPPGYAALRR